MHFILQLYVTAELSLSSTIVDLYDDDDYR